VSISILTPLAAALALLGVVPVLALRAGEGRALGIARSLGLSPRGSPPRAAVVAVVATAVLLGVAASQPVLKRDDRRSARTDAEAYVVLDTSLSMLASASPGQPTRLDRARELAVRIRPQLEDVPVGIASLTDRVLPHLFPTTDSEVYTATVERAMRVENPPPDRHWASRATTFEALSALATRNFFSDSATSRAIVVLTDGETRPYSASALAADLDAPPGIVPVVVHVWRDGERLYIGRQLDRGYASDPTSERPLRRLAAATGGAVLGEGDASAIVRALRDALGQGPRASAGGTPGTTPLAPWLILAASLPLGFLVARRIL
jgi:hypothetical protein